MKKIKPKYITIGIIIILISGLVFFYTNLTHGNEALIFTTSPADNTLNKIMQASKNGDEINITAPEINGILEMYHSNFSNINENIEIKNLLCELKENTLMIYVPTKVYGVNTLLSCEGILTYNQSNFIFTPNSLKIGKIDMPINFILTKLSQLDNSNIKIVDNNIIISSEILPVSIDKFEITNGSINLAFSPMNNSDSKSEAKENTNDSKENSNNSSTNTKLSKEDAQKKELQTVSYQLSKVYKAVKTTEEKAIISSIQSVVKKMIADPNYSYQKEADAVKSRYSKLTAEEKSDIKNAILMNMSMSSLRKLNETFNLL